MKHHAWNAAWGIIDYAVYPAMMLLVAPIVLHRLGAAEYGIWSIATAIISVGGILASGFSDANIRQVASLRANSNPEEASTAMLQMVRSLLSIHLCLGSFLALASFVLAPLLAARLVRAHPEELHACLHSIQIASLLILIRALETVPVSVQRAFEDFSAAVRFSAATRIVTLVAAAGLVLLGHHVVSLLAAAGLAMCVGTALQYRELLHRLGLHSLRPSFHSASLRTLLHQGAFTWLQTFSGVIFSQLDRVVVGIVVGAAGAAPYLLCVQFAHPISGLTASALAFLFPHLSRRATTATRAELMHTLARAFLCNLLLVLSGAALLLLFGERIIHSWSSASIASVSAQLLPFIAIGTALTGLSVTATCALFAFGRFRLVAVTNVSIRALMLLVIFFLTPHYGLLGLAWVRLLYGAMTLLLYVPLWQQLRDHDRTRLLPSALGAPAREGACL